MPAKSAKTNPVGIPAVASNYPAVMLVRVGKKGEFTHIFDPDLRIDGTSKEVIGAPLCGSGYRSKNNDNKNSGNRHVPELYRALDARYVTCTRCIKLATVNLGKYGSLLPRTR